MIEEEKELPSSSFKHDIKDSFSAWDLIADISLDDEKLIEQILKEEELFGVSIPEYQKIIAQSEPISQPASKTKEK